MTQSIHTISAVKDSIRVNQRDDDEGEVLQKKLALLVLGEEVVDDALESVRGGGFPWVNSAGKHHVGFVELSSSSFDLKEGEQ